MCYKGKYGSKTAKIAEKMPEFAKYKPFGRIIRIKRKEGTNVTRTSGNEAFGYG